MVLLATLVSVFVLSSAWEFLFEDLVGFGLGEEHEPETLAKRIEYVVSITIFAALSLIFPATVGYKLIENQEKLTEKIKLAFDKNKISIPYPQMDVHLDKAV